MRLKNLAPLLLILAAACGGSTRYGTFPAPGDAPPYPSLNGETSIWAEAIYFTNHADVFGRDLTKKGILPIGLRVGLRGEQSATASIDASEFDPHLYLQDGTVLNWFPSDDIERKNRRVRQQIDRWALQPSLLQEWDPDDVKFVFFQFDPDKVRLQATAANTSGHVSRELDLLRSLLSFNVSVGEGTQPMNVGLRSARLNQ